MREQSSHNNFVRERMVFTTTLAYSLPSFLYVCIMLHCVDLYLYLFVYLLPLLIPFTTTSSLTSTMANKSNNQAGPACLIPTGLFFFFPNWAGLAGLGKAGHIRDTQPGFSLGRCWRRCRSLFIMASLLFTAVVFANIGVFYYYYSRHLTFSPDICISADMSEKEGGC